MCWVPFLSNIDLFCLGGALARVSEPAVVFAAVVFFLMLFATLMRLSRLQGSDVPEPEDWRPGDVLPGRQGLPPRSAEQVPLLDLNRFLMEQMPFMRGRLGGWSSISVSPGSFEGSAVFRTEDMMIILESVCALAVLEARGPAQFIVETRRSKGPDVPPSDSGSGDYVRVVFRLKPENMAAANRDFLSEEIMYRRMISRALENTGGFMLVDRASPGSIDVNIYLPCS